MSTTLTFCPACGCTHTKNIHRNATIQRIHRDLCAARFALEESPLKPKVIDGALDCIKHSLMLLGTGDHFTRKVYEKIRSIAAMIRASEQDQNHHPSPDP